MSGLYSYFMNKYNWTPSVIDNLCFKDTMRVEFGEWRELENKKAKEGEIQFIDEIGF